MISDILLLLLFLFLLLLLLLLMLMMLLVLMLIQDTFLESLVKIGAVTAEIMLTLSFPGGCGGGVDVLSHFCV